MTLGLKGCQTMAIKYLDLDLQLPATNVGLGEGQIDFGTANLLF